MSKLDAARRAFRWAEAGHDLRIEAQDVLLEVLDRIHAKLDTGVQLTTAEREFADEAELLPPPAKRVLRLVERSEA